MDIQGQQMAGAAVAGNRLAEEKHIRLHTTLRECFSAISGEANRVLERIRTGVSNGSYETGEDSHPPLTEFLSESPEKVRLATRDILAALRMIEMELFTINHDKKPGTITEDQLAGGKAFIAKQ